MKKAVEGKGLAPAIGPYSAAITFGDMIFTSGQIAMDPHTGELALGNSIEEETERVLNNVQAVLLAAGADLSCVVKTSIFLSSMDLFPNVNEVYGRYFQEPYPARETVAVKTLPKNVNVEISCIAMRKR
jgi:2-iminobutanoate/2-iminopropanoate deaminase